MEFQHYWSALKRHWLPATLIFSTISALSVINWNFQEPIYRAQATLRFTRDTTPSLTGVGEEQEDLAPLIADTNPITTEMGIIRSIPIVQATINQLGLKNESGEPLKPNQFLNRLNLNSERGTDLLEISYIDPNPQTAEAVVNILMKVYLNKHLQENRAQTVAAREFIERELPTAEASVHRAEAALRRFKEENQVASLEEESVAIVGAQEELRRRIAEAGSELANANAQAVEFYNQLRMNPQEAIAATALSQSPGVQEALTQLQTIEVQLSIERVRFYDAHPVVSDLEARRTNLLTLLNQRIDQTLRDQVRPNTDLQIGELRATLAGEFVRSEIRRRGLNSQVRTLSNAQTFYKQRISALPGLEQEHRELIRQLEAAQSTYSLLLSKLYEIQVTENQNVGNARIIQDAYAFEKPVAPQPMSHILMGGILATIGAVAMALALEASDKSIRTVKEARAQFGISLLGVIPFHQGLFSIGENVEPLRSEVIVRDIPASSVNESFLVLRANLKSLRMERLLKTIVVTSSTPHEGKSVVSANLAMAIAQAGRRVLLVDANLRSPRQDGIWNVSDQPGLSNLIVDSVELNELIHDAALNLHLLTTGITSSNPATLLDSHRMAVLMEQFSTHYDVVIIDTPSLSTAADASILGEMADGVMLVTRPGYVDVVNANIAKERLQRLGNKVLGQVLNGVFDETEPYRHRDYQGTYSENRNSHSPALTRN